MSVEEALLQLAADFHAGKVTVRREAVERAAKLLKQRACQEPCRQRIVELLTAAAGDIFSSVADAAKNVLCNLEAGYDPLWGADDRKHMVGVPCKGCGHVTYFDRRLVCNDSRPLYRTVVRGEQGEELHEIHEKCGACGKPLKFRVDCGEVR